MSSVEKYIPLYTVDDYRHWQGDWELWQGHPVSMSPSPFGRHGSIVVNVGAALKTAIESRQCNASVIADVDWIISTDTVLRPDVFFVCGRPPEQHLEKRPEIVVEILSTSTQSLDLIFKRQIYQEQCVPYCLILDPDDRQLTALRLDAEKYSQMQFSETIDLEICGDCNLEIAVASLFS